MLHLGCQWLPSRCPSSVGLCSHASLGQPPRPLMCHAQARPSAAGTEPRTYSDSNGSQSPPRRSAAPDKDVRDMNASSISGLVQDSRAPLFSAGGSTWGEVQPEKEQHPRPARPPPGRGETAAMRSTSGSRAAQQGGVMSPGSRQRLPDQPTARPGPAPRERAAPPSFTRGSASSASSSTSSSSSSSRSSSMTSSSERPSSSNSSSPTSRSLRPSSTSSSSSSSRTTAVRPPPAPSSVRGSDGSSSRSQPGTRREESNRGAVAKAVRQIERLDMEMEEPPGQRRGSCYGCGARLQVSVPLGPGYVAPEKYDLKALHRQLKQVLCVRCQGLSHGVMIPGVEDFTQKLQAKALLEQAEATEEAIELLGKVLITPERLRLQLLEVREKKAIVVMLVDLTDVAGTLMGKVRDMVGRNPIVLVGTKMDLLPEGTHPRDVADWLMEAALRKRLNVISCHLVSSHSGEGVTVVTRKVSQERQGRDVYVIGAANVGKSAFVRAMLKDMSRFEGMNFDPAALANARYLPTESPMPGTTLGLIALQAYASGGTLFDTPGVHLHHRVPHMLSPAELKLLHPRKRLAPLVPPTPRQLTPLPPAQQPMRSAKDHRDLPTATATKAGRQQPVACTYVWSDLVRVDVVGAPPTTTLAFYGPSSLRVAAQPLAKAVEQVTMASANQASSPPSTTPSASSSSSSSSPEDAESSSPGAKVLLCGGSVAARGGLVPHTLRIKVDGSRRPLADVCISGLPGWITVWAPGARQDVPLRVWAPKGVQVFLRPPLPCPSPLREPASQQEDEEGGELDDKALVSLMTEYGAGSGSIDINSAEWWEAAMAELDGIDAEKDEDEAEEEEEDDDEEAAAASGARGFAGRSRTRGAKAGGKERVIMSATVEDILRRPRLDAGFDALMDDDADEEPDERKQRPARRRVGLPRPPVAKETSAQAAVKKGLGGRRRMLAMKGAEK